jgi:hypothetical protein
MNRMLAAFAVAVSLVFTGCAQLQTIGDGISLATKSIANPVTKSEEAQVELALDTAVQALKAYKAACVNGTADKNCRANIAQIQAYTRQVPALVAQLRNFVDNNDQINATVIYNQLTALYANVKGAAKSLNVSLGSTP